MDVSENELQGLYTWVDEIPLSRPKRNIARDFSDGVLIAEIIHHYFPKLLELHNYSPANALQQKMYNWNTLNQKGLKKLGFTVNKADFEAAANCEPGAVERVLKLIRTKISKFKDDEPAYPTPKETAPAYQYAAAPMVMEVTLPPPSPQGPLPMLPSAAALRTIANSTPEVLMQKDSLIRELNETNEILETKVRKLEQLVRLKDAKIQTLMAKLSAAGMS